MSTEIPKEPPPCPITALFADIYERGDSDAFAQQVEHLRTCCPYCLAEVQRLNALHDEAPESESPEWVAGVGNYVKNVLIGFGVFCLIGVTLGMNASFRSLMRKSGGK